MTERTRRVLSEAGAVPFDKLLVANRGEIAVRVTQACAELGIRTVAVYSSADVAALHVRRAGESVLIGPAPPAESYLSVERIVSAARASGAQAVHPGYGFLSENPRLAEACREVGIAFVGPPPEAMRLLGSKRAARALARREGVPVVPGYDGEAQDLVTLAGEAERIGYPLLIKASAGGGGRGLRAVGAASELEPALASAKREAFAAFGDDTVLLERLIERPRHVEFQVMADTHGNVVHLGERDCSVQRRYQKVIEESPSPALTPALRARMGEAAVAVMRAAGYVNAGTVEFMLSPDGSFYFLEVNARLQVEHPVTECVTGIDLVREQIRVASGGPLSMRQEDIRPRGHAIECRVYAEDPAQRFRPSTGTLRLFEPPAGAGIRHDTGVETGDVVPPHYDSLLAKLIVSAADRDACIARAGVALRAYAVLGVTTNLPLLAAVVASPEFTRGDVWTGFLEARLPSLIDQGGTTAHGAPAGRAAPGGRPAGPGGARRAALAAAGDAGGAGTGRDPGTIGGVPPEVTAVLDAWVAAGRGQDGGRNPWRSAEQPRSGDRGGAEAPEVYRTGPHQVLVRLGTESLHAWVVETADAFHVSLRGVPYVVPKRRGLAVDDVVTAAGTPTGATGPGRVEAPLAGTVARVEVNTGTRVAAGQPVVVLEAMKMEIAVEAPRAGTVTRVACAAGDLVQAGTLLIEVE